MLLLLITLTVVVIIIIIIYSYSKCSNSLVTVYKFRETLFLCPRLQIVTFIIHLGKKDWKHPAPTNRNANRTFVTKGAQKDNQRNNE